MIVNADAVAWAKSQPSETFHAMLCDPPYHLQSIVDRFGKEGAASPKEGVYNRSSRGFMGATWDGGNTAFEAETWCAFLRLLMPGAFVFAFCGSRGWHRQAVAMEDAGFIFHPSIFMFGYSFGSGFPKATRVRGDNRLKDHRYGLQALKPALEPIILAQKPYRGRPVDNITMSGAGSLNIGAGRIGTNGEIPSGSGLPAKSFHRDAIMPGRSGGNGGNKTTGGRWPSNFLIGDSCAAAALDRQSGSSFSSGGKGKATAENAGVSSYGWSRGDTWEGAGAGGYKDSGGASRFFYQVRRQIDEAEPVFYTSKPGRRERNIGTNGNGHACLKPLDLCKYLGGLLLPPAEFAPRRLLNPFAGTNSEAIGALLAGWEEVVSIELSAEYCAIGEARRRFWSCNSGLFDQVVAENAQEESQLDLFAEVEG